MPAAPFSTRTHISGGFLESNWKGVLGRCLPLCAGLGTVCSARVLTHVYREGQRKGGPAHLSQMALKADPRPKGKQERKLGIVI